MKCRLLLIFLFLAHTPSYAQDFNYTISIEAQDHDGPGLHSYAFGEADGKWLFVGGRVDGLHPRQPFAAFSQTFNNNQLHVLDPETGQHWSRDLSELETSLEEQLQSTNPQFTQVNDTLYFIGGYAYSNSENDHITFPFITTIGVSETINAIISGDSISSFFKSVYDDRFAVTGGQLRTLDGKFILVGGHRFDGRYNPMGHNTYVQSYTNSIKRFKVDNSGVDPIIASYEEEVDPIHLHRRDYNLVPQVFADGEFGYMISSGVFQTTINLPYLYPVEIRMNEHVSRTEFNQYLSNYHSAHVTLYDSSLSANYSIFFGGMSQYYYDNDELIEDQNVPFVKTISMVVRNEFDELEERIFEIEMPSFAGAGSEFMINRDLELIDNEIIALNEELEDSTLLGYIYGGITSSATNPFSSNQTSLTAADDNLIKVWLIKENTSSSATTLNLEHQFTFRFLPNPSKDRTSVELSTDRSGTVHLSFYDLRGRMILGKTVTARKGIHEHEINFDNRLSPGVYEVTGVLNDAIFAQQTLIIE